MHKSRLFRLRLPLDAIRFRLISPIRIRLMEPIPGILEMARPTRVKIHLLRPIPCRNLMNIRILKVKDSMFPC